MLPKIDFKVCYDVTCCFNFQRSVREACETEQDVKLDRHPVAECLCLSHVS